MITKKQLAESMSNSSVDYEKHIQAVNDALKAAECNTLNRVAMFLAQTGHESLGLRYFTEISDGLYLRGRKDLDHGPNEGEQWRGRGPIQLTGKANYRSFGKWCKQRGLVSDELVFVKNPTKVAEPKWGWLAASWYWTQARPQINSLCDADDLVAVTKAINGGTRGLEDRRTRYYNAKRILQQGGMDMTIEPHHGRRGDPVWLPEVLRAFGVEVKELPGWKDWGVGDFDDIRGVACHHTAGANTSAQFIARNPMLGNQLSSQIHLGRDGVATMCGAGIAWHFGEAEKPSFPEVLRGYVNRKSNGAWKSYTAANARMIAIEAVNAGDGSQPWPQVQMDAYARICAAICWYLGLPVSSVLGHKEGTARKIDPNFDMNAFRKSVQKYVNNPPFKGGSSGGATMADGSLFGKDQVGALHEAKVASKEALEVAKRTERKVDLILDQLAGPERNNNGMPKFTGWRGDQAWPGTGGVTTVQNIVTSLDDIKKQLNKEKK